MTYFIKVAACVLTAATVFLTGCAGTVNQSGTSSSSSSVSASETSTVTTTASTYDYAKKALDASYNAGAQTINLDKKSGTVSITSAGEYIITGTLADGHIEVDADDDVQLILYGAAITSNGSAAIIALNGDLIITLADGTQNSVTANGITEEADAAIYASDDLYFNGGGALTVACTDGDAIAGKDDVAFISGKYDITAADDGIRGKDALAICGGTFTITAEGDGLKSTNDTDDDEGCVYLDGGTFDITAGADGVQAETALYVTDAVFDITSGGGVENAVQKTTEKMGGGKQGGRMQQSGAAPNMMATAFTTEQTAITDTTADSFNGLKAGTAINIYGGEVTINSADDAVHTNGICTISGGSLTLASGDDSVHADDTLNISGGSVTVTQSYEGLEATTINITGGECDVTASDDGLNAAGGSDIQSTQFDKFAQGTGALNISGGTVYVDAAGDGLDANGSIDISGGTTIVNGPENSGNGALDYDGTCTVSGGTLIALGASGMAQAPSGGSQAYIMATLSQTQGANTEITIQDASGNTIYTVTSAKSFNSIVASTSEMKSGTSYTVTAGNVTGTATAK